MLYLAKLAVIRIPARIAEGFTRSLFKLMNLQLSVPSYTQICRRAQTLHKQIKRLLKDNKKHHIIFDSTGLKVYGEGEWKIKKHGKSKRRTWRKFHIGIDAVTQDILCCELTHNDKGDAQTAEKMLESFDKKIKSVREDGAYDGNCFRKKVHAQGGTCIIPPPRGAVYKGAQAGWQRERDDALAAIVGFGGGEDGRRLWKMCSNYHTRSLVETCMFRVKKLIGNKLKARSFGAQQTEDCCKCLIINKINNLGLPQGKWLLKVA